MKKPIDDGSTWGIFLLALMGIFLAYMTFISFSPIGRFLIVIGGVIALGTFLLVWYSNFSEAAKEKNEKRNIYIDIPKNLKEVTEGCVLIGKERDLTVPLYLPESIRSRHVHILGATGSGKTESVVLNFLKQDIAIGRGAIILDAKGDDSFQKCLKAWLPDDRLQILDLSNPHSLGFDPVAKGSAIEGAQRLHASLSWSEDYYKAKAFTALLRLFEKLSQKFDRNPTLLEINTNLYSAGSYAAAVAADSTENPALIEGYKELAGLCDQVKALTLGNLSQLLSPSNGTPQVNLEDALKGKVIYFRLQSLISPQTVATVGKLIINNINYLAGTAHRLGTNDSGSAIKRELVPVFLDEFAAFACPEFADLISMARSAKFALHFSHQSIGDLLNVGKPFVSQITDNSGTKIIMRVNDPDTAEYFAKTFGTRLIKKVTQRITNTEGAYSAELTGDGSSREAHQFRASPDLLKTLPTGMAACLIAHGESTKEGASHVFTIKFPRLEENI